LKVKAEKEYVHYPGQFRIDDIRKATTIGEFDDAYIAPIYGFRDKHHYYEVCGAKAWLHKIRVPAIAVNARDDPIVDEPSLPTEEHVRDAPVRLIYHDHGGHCGFYTLQGSMQCGEGAGSGDVKVPAHGWLAEELARAIDHIHNSHMQL
jgi:predicted alpha/beta-fold hydrolase